MKVRIGMPGSGERDGAWYFFQWQGPRWGEREASPRVSAERKTPFQETELCTTEARRPQSGSPGFVIQ